MTAAKIKIRIEEVTEAQRQERVKIAINYLDAQSEKMYKHLQTSRSLHRVSEGPLTEAECEPEVGEWLRNAGFKLVKRTVPMGDLVFFLEI